MLGTVNTAMGMVGGLVRSLSGLGGVQNRTASPSTQPDRVDLSPAARQLAASGGKSPSNSVRVDMQGALTLDRLRKDLGESLGKLQEALDQHFTDYGVETEAPPVALALDSEGAVRVTNDHPHAAAIEGIFQRNQELAERFKEVNNLARQLHHADQAALVNQGLGPKPNPPEKSDPAADAFLLYIQGGNYQPWVGAMPTDEE